MLKPNAVLRNDGDPPTVEAWTTAITNMPPELALQMRDHAIRSLKNDTRWSVYVMLAERSFESAASRESKLLPGHHEPTTGGERMPGDPPVVTNLQKLIVALDGEIARLQEARDLLTRDNWIHGVKTAAKHPMSAEGRARISAAQKKRWAAIKQAARTAAK
jgi:hypothetical protein